MRAILADDSVVFRSQMKVALQSIAGITAVETAKNGQLALEAMEREEFDVLVLDMEMPVLDGMGTLKEIQKRGIKTKVIVFSAVTAQGSQNALEATRLGAVGIVGKPSGEGQSATNAADKIKEQLEPPIRQLIDHRKMIEEARARKEVSKPSSDSSTSSYSRKEISTFLPDCIVIASSTGGPGALEIIYSHFKVSKMRIPILLAQHMPPMFTASLAQRLSEVSGLPCKEFENGEVIEPATYICPGDFHVRLKKENGVVRAYTDQGPRINYVRPAADPLFETAAKIYDMKLLGVVLTGMGNDGAQGCEFVKKNNGGVIIQEESTCAVFGMAGAVKQSGAYDLAKTPEEIGAEFTRMVRG